MRRRIQLAMMATIAVAGLGLAGCAPGATAVQADQPGLSLAAAAGDAGLEADLLTTMTGGELGQLAPEPSSGAKAKRRPVRPLLRKKVLHAEAVLATDGGTRTVLLQHGSVTAIGSGSITVKSSDGFNQVYQLNDATRVVAAGKKSDIGSVTNGADIGIAGDKSGESVTAVLIVVPKK